MQNNFLRILAGCSLGGLFGVLGAIVGLLGMMTYGGETGCTILGGGGYEACGGLGFFVGEILGSVFGVWFFERGEFKKYKTITAIATILIIISPLIIANRLLGWSFLDGTIFYIVSSTGIFLLASIIPSLFTIWIFRCMRKSSV